MQEMKYLKPQSLTWWASAVPLFVGLFLAFEEVHEWYAMVNVINNMTGGISAALLINAGLAGIGLRGKDG